MRAQAINHGLPIDEYETDESEEDDEAVWKIDDETSSVEAAYLA